MKRSTTRRAFLRSTLAGGAAAGSAAFALGDPGLLTRGVLPRLRPVSAEESRLAPEAVRLHPEIEPLVRLLEETPRERLLEEVAARIRRGLSYREILAALLLAGVRNIQPRPSVGFKFHGVLVVNSAHLASLSSPDADRWLPIFWALDYFKDCQARDVREGDWTLGPVDEKAVPPGHGASRAFEAAMEGWDEPAADAAAAALARSAGAQEVFELFFRLGARDFRSIGHKAIYVANSWRTLATIGWHHAEPVLRSLAYALLQHEGENPSTRDAEADRPLRRNRELAGRIRSGWQDGAPSDEAAAELLETFRSGSDADAAEKVVEVLDRGVSPQSIWDALFCGAAELVLRQPGIVALHAETTTNALRFAWETSGVDETRRLLLLQNASFLPLFRGAMGGRGRVEERRIDRLTDGLEPAKIEEGGSGRQSLEALEAIFAELGRDRAAASRRTLAWLESGGNAAELVDPARRLIFQKGNDSHDYKYSSAVFEDYRKVSPAWSARYLAASVALLTGSGGRDNPLVARTRAALDG